ncbi:MAG: hypothetical protein LBE92_03915 [Chryseobacterium sp.]|jgi:hypothetical protein|uniref:hypothetical protein n=1 Tax=Chryseobacterium sp. TaxID=1871047 RepID=UPI002839FFD5|nr:hypothetical protein [Chryseobacterium sp.]MDR2235248.1 hypothetical protein [Chryseobacterium sp.]
MEKPIRKIHFSDNPYPEGHDIIDFIWRGRINEDETIWFDFHLKTDHYGAGTADNNEDEENEDISDWHSRSVWNNYQSCTMSSMYWGEEGGIRIDEPDKKLNLHTAIENELSSTDLPSDYYFEEEDLAFGLYLLGHDNCAGHTIKFIKTDHPQQYDIEWKGKIALSYSGDYEFSHDFNALIRSVEFDGFHYPKEWSLERATEVFRAKLDGFEDYEFIDLNPKSNKREYKLCPIQQL